MQIDRFALPKHYDPRPFTQNHGSVVHPELLWSKRNNPGGRCATRLGLRPHKHVASAEGDSALVAGWSGTDAAMALQAAGNTPSCRMRLPVSQ